MMALAAVILALSVVEYLHGEADNWHRPTLMAMQSIGTSESPEKVSPLVEQAAIFARYLNRFEVTAKRDVSKGPIDHQEPACVARGAIATPVPKFDLHGTIYCPAHPEKSMALIWELDSHGGSRRWTREGDLLGGFIIDEIRVGSLTCRSGQQTHEVPVKHRVSPPQLVRGHQPHAREVSTTANDKTQPSQPPGLSAFVFTNH